MRRHRKLLRDYPMNRSLLPLLVIVGVVLLEIFGFAWVGSSVGALGTVFLVVATAVVGLWIFRLQGVRHWQRLQAQLDQGELPAQDLIEGWLLLLAAVLLVVPGFFSDAIGGLLLVPPLRAVAAAWIRGNKTIWVAAARHSATGQKIQTIEGEFRRTEEAAREQQDRLRDRDER